jgi:hypothetical protein
MSSGQKTLSHAQKTRKDKGEDATMRRRTVSKRNIKIVIASTAKQSPYCGECSL